MPQVEEVFTDPVVKGQRFTRSVWAGDGCAGVGKGWRAQIGRVEPAWWAATRRWVFCPPAVRCRPCPHPCGRQEGVFPWLQCGLPAGLWERIGAARLAGEELVEWPNENEWTGSGCAGAEARQGEDLERVFEGGAAGLFLASAGAAVWGAFPRRQAGKQGGAEVVSLLDHVQDGRKRGVCGRWGVLAASAGAERA